MAYRVAINGFGRIGRMVFRSLAERNLGDVEVVAVNDLFDPEQLALLLKYDSAQPPFAGEITVEGDTLKAGGQSVKFLKERDLSKLPWEELKVDTVIEATGVFRKPEQFKQHVRGPVKHVILTVPAKGEIDATVVLGVNDEILSKDKVSVSNASCTTNCAAPMAKVLHDHFGVKRGIMTTIHAYTADQRLIDTPHSDMRRARAAAVSIIPTTTGAAKAIGVVIPDLKGKLDGMALRVPTPTGSFTDFNLELGKETTVEAINQAFREAAEGPLKGILEYTEDPIVSHDIVHNPHSCIFDAGITQVMGGNLVKVGGWYDNEWGYSCRVVDLLLKLKDMDA